MSSRGSGRRYDASGRQRDAAQRQSRVLQAAHALFLGQGYGATSVEQIAQRAGTSAQTVYGVFGSKAGVLRRVVDVAVGGDEQDVKLLERPEYAAVFASPDLRELFREVAKLGARTHARSGELICLVEASSGADPAVKTLATDLRVQMRSDAERFIDSIGDRLRPDLERDHAVDVVMLIGAPRGWQEMVGERGWTQDEYELWFADALWRNLVDGTSAPANDTQAVVPPRG